MIYYFKRRKRFIFLLLFISSLLHANSFAEKLIAEVQNKRLYQTKIWQNLTHSNDGFPSINDSSFLLSYPNFSLEKELIATIKAFRKPQKLNEKHAICQYPARFFWLQKELDFEKKNFPILKCEKFDEYLAETNADNIALVFSSENVTNPSSMMGHTFFKISGKEPDGTNREHAVSFFTVIDTVNIPWLIIKSTMLGMQGFFSLSPYVEQLHSNLIIEERNIWAYDLDLSPDEKKLLYYHFWELKDVNLKYLFTGFNCATIIDDMLFFSSKKVTDTKRLWITPKDLVKETHKLGLIKSTKLIPSDKWYIKMLDEELNYKKKNEIFEIFNDKKYERFLSFNFSEDKKQNILEKELITHYSHYLYDNKMISQENLKQIKQENADSDVIDLKNYKSPIKTYDDSKLTVGYLRDNQENFLKFSFLPASNTLYGDNREYFSETSMKIFEINILANKDQVKLESLDLYSMKSLIPRDVFTKGISSQFELNYETHYDKNIDSYQAYNLSTGIGVTKKIGNDIFVYSLFNIGLAYGKSEFYSYLYPELGFMIYELLNMKTTIQYKYLFNQHNSKNTYHNLELIHSIFINKDISMEIEIQNQWRDKLKNERFNLSFNYYF